MYSYFSDVLSITFSYFEKINTDLINYGDTQMSTYLSTVFMFCVFTSPNYLSKQKSSPFSCSTTYDVSSHSENTCTPSNPKLTERVSVSVHTYLSLLKYCWFGIMSSTESIRIPSTV